MAETDWLSLKDVADRYGVSESKARRRIVKVITADENHVDRSLVEPSHEEWVANKRKGVQVPWKLHRNLDFEEYLKDTRPGRKKDASPESPDAVNTKLVELLRVELEEKKKEIDDLRKELKIARNALQIMMLFGRRKARKLLQLQFPEIVKKLQAGTSILSSEQDTNKQPNADSSDKNAKTGKGMRRWM